MNSHLSSHPVAILSHPMHGNYGGMLQAYALAKLVGTLVSQVKLYQLPVAEINLSPWQKLKKLVRITQYFFGCPGHSAGATQTLLSHRMALNFRKHCVAHGVEFVSDTNNTLTENTTWIVGSDQVWRGQYAEWLKTLPFFFLDFTDETTRRRSISYAASFGTDEWEGSPEDTAVCTHLLKEFKAVSVREESALALCRDVFGVEATRMPDPTLLLTREDYDDLIQWESTSKSTKPYVAAYVLDETPEKLDFLNNLALTHRLAIEHLDTQAQAKERSRRFPISVSQWLRRIRDAEYIVTDSFHGTVFAIIFHKPFVCLGNEERGTARFNTLLSSFCLESRLVTDIAQAQKVLESPIDWEHVSSVHAGERLRGYNFLKENLL